MVSIQQYRRICFSFIPMMVVGWAGGLTAGGCKSDKPLPISQTAVASSSPVAKAAPSMEPELSRETGNDRLRSVYPDLVGPVDPQAKRLCALLHDYPAERKKACCATTTFLHMTQECERMLTHALHAKAITLADKAIDGCEQALKEQLQGCDWVQPLWPTPPAVCQVLVHGVLDAGKRCRSSLECQSGLHCEGLGTTKSGICMPEKTRGKCQQGVDALAGMVRASSSKLQHRECQGFCARGQCKEKIAIGKACLSSVQCGPGNHCQEKVCATGEQGKRNQPCLDRRCEDGTQCFQGKCLVPKKENEECTEDAQCRGLCIRSADNSKGKCSKQCSTMIRRPVPKH
jgi:hypothetical protein